jgi:Amidohydrolase
MSNTGSVQEAQWTRIAEIRASLDHPIVDGDGHLQESVPLLFDHVRRIGGPVAVDALVGALPDLFTGRGDAAVGEGRGPWWPAPMEHQYLATVMAPALYAERLPELGFDFAVLYPSLGLALCTLPDASLRQLACRALNTMNAEICGPHAARLTPAAVVPMHTPEEAVAELTFAVRDLGLKVASIPPAVARPLEAFPDAFPAVSRPDWYAIDSAADYDPVWQAFEELEVAVTVHGGVGFRYLPIARRSPTNYAFNHLHGHADGEEGLCRALVFGGVPRRFPHLQFGFLEAGVLWAVSLLAGIEERFEKRGARGLVAYDPRRLDAERLGELLVRYGLPPDGPGLLEPPGAESVVRDELADSGIRDEQDLARIFAEQFFFGCESDDPAVHRALDGPGNPLGVVFRPVLSSDFGHWDVPYMDDVLPQSRRLVDRGLMDAAGYRRFAFEYPVMLHAGMNPRFFDGTHVAAEARALIDSAPARQDATR